MREPRGPGTARKVISTTPTSREVSDPAVRDERAKFDPKKQASADLLAGVGGLGFEISAPGGSESP